MKLMTKAIERQMPALYATEGVALADKVARVKFFTPWSGWTWYGIEYDPQKRMFFGLVDSGADKEFGYFSLDELMAIRGPYGWGIERDLHFGARRLGDMSIMQRRIQSEANKALLREYREAIGN